MRLLLITCLLWSSATMSAVVRPLGFEALKSRATHISVSEVIALESFWDSGRILTWVTLSPSQIYRGKQSSLRVLVPGGTVGMISQRVPGGPIFEVGEESLYFLEPMPTLDGLRLVGFMQGKVNESGSTAQRFAMWNRRLEVGSTHLTPQSDSNVKGRGL